MKIFYWVIFLFIPVFTYLTPIVYARSDYVLPYPSAMPGSKWYKIRVIIEQIDHLWYFGNFAQFKYNLKSADKYLVEAKTLFEYKQYLHGYNALLKSNQYFKQTRISLTNAKKEDKNIDEKELVLKGAAKKHSEVLGELLQKIPESFYWVPEKGTGSFLPLAKTIKNSLLLRKRYE